MRVKQLSWSLALAHGFMCTMLTRMFHDLTLRDREDGHATGQTQGFASEAYLNSTSQGAKPEDARKDAHMRGRSKSFMKYPG